MYVLIVLFAGTFAGVGYEVKFDNLDLCKKALAKVERMSYFADASCLQVKDK